MKDKTAFFTGHRTLPILKLGLTRKLKKVIISLINEGYCFFGTGGALGFDTLAAKTVLALKSKYPHIKLILVLPCTNQANRWNEKDKRLYEKIKAGADKITYTSQAYYKGCMHKRNRHLADNSSICICYLTKDSGGTFYTVNYAKSNNLKIINLG